VALTTLHVMGLPEIVSSTDCIATVPAPLGGFFADLKRIRCLPTPFRSPVFDVNLYWSWGTQDDPANQWLRRLIERTFAQA